MTREEAIKILNELYDTYIQCHGEEDIIEISIDSVDIEALYMAIKALEQEPILDKIRTEIEHLTITEGGEDYIRKMAELYSLKIKILQIIDKYKAESEVGDGKV